MLSQKLKQELEYYEKLYFALDEPVPYKGGLEVYPVLVKDYYKFYTALTCITMNKNVKKEKYIDDKGNEAIREVSNPQGISMSYLAYLISCMQQNDIGPLVTSQVITLLEMVFHIQNGIYCPDCEKQCGGDKDKLENIRAKTFTTYENLSSGLRAFDSIQDKDEKISKQREYLKHILTCPVCGGNRREVFSIKNQGEQGRASKLCIRDIELNNQDFERLRAIITHYNIVDYKDDVYIDPDLKEELDIKAQMQNKDYTSPTLEKQLICVSISTPYTIEQLKEISMRKLSLMLKTIDAKESYYAQVQAMYSGMVKFKQDPKHWIFSDNSRDISKELTTLDDVKKKFAPVTGG